MRIQAFAMRFMKTTGSFLISLFMLLLLSFFLMLLTPGDPFCDEIGTTPELLEALKKSHGLDQSIPHQFFTYVCNLLHGDLGRSIRYTGEPVSEIIARSFPISLELGVQAFLIALPLGTMVGLLSAYLSKKRGSAVSSLFLTLAISIPTFVVAVLIQHLFSIVVPLFPIARWDSFAHTILPTLSLALVPTASIARIMKTSALEVMNKEYVFYARMRGIPERRVALWYILPNAFLPCLQYVGPTVANMLFGSFAVERVYAIPGLGQWFVSSILSRDYPVIAGLTAFYSVLLFSTGFIIQLFTERTDTRLQDHTL